MKLITYEMAKLILKNEKNGRKIGEFILKNCILS